MSSPAGLSKEALAAHNRLGRRGVAGPLSFSRGLTVPPGTYKTAKRDRSPIRNGGLGNRRHTTHLGLTHDDDKSEKDSQQSSSHVEKTSMSSRHSIGSVTNLRKHASKWRHGKTCTVTLNGKGGRLRAAGHENSYKMEPDKASALSMNRIQSEVKSVLEQCFDVVDAYDPRECAILSRTTSEEIKARVKRLGFTRYKIVAHVVIGQNMRQGLHVASRGAWDTKTDDVITVVHEKNDFFVVATVFGIYFE